MHFNFTSYDEVILTFCKKITFLSVTKLQNGRRRSFSVAIVPRLSTRKVVLGFSTISVVNATCHVSQSHYVRRLLGESSSVVPDRTVFRDALALIATLKARRQPCIIALEGYISFLSRCFLIRWRKNNPPAFTRYFLMLVLNGKGCEQPTIFLLFLKRTFLLLLEHMLTSS